MATLIPTPVTLEALIDDAHVINSFNDGATPQADAPRLRGTDTITVEVTDDPFVSGSAYWSQKNALGEWVRDTKLGNNVIVNYTLPVDLSNADVHMVVYPWDLTDIANYPAK